jgi:hypothetical protein
MIDETKEVVAPKFNLEWIERQATALQQLANRGILPTREDPKTHEKQQLALQTGKAILGALSLFYLRGLEASLRDLLVEEQRFHELQRAALAQAAPQPVDPQPPAECKQNCGESFTKDKLPPEVDA